MNLLALPPVLPPDELFEPLAGGEEVLVERIVSAGQATPPGEWLEQGRDEWVALLQGEAELSLADGTRVVLGPGDHVLIAAGTRHRVERTSVEPPCIWLAVHARGLAAPAAEP
ncbi:MAG TPA: cupin domain-containing protein [Gaiellaceae bacterium]|nr:cupin domain-containing protein [Gaiellaceae bacterium]